MSGKDLYDIDVLYVEDEDGIRNVMCGFLRRRARNVYEAENGERGLEAYYKYKPNVIITDDRMPIMNGMDMIGEIRKFDRATLIIITTAFNSESTYLRAIDYGVMKLIKKPVAAAELDKAITTANTLIAHQRMQDEKNKLYSLVLAHTTSLVLIVQDDQVIFINRAMLEFAFVRDMETFNQRNIMELIVEADKHSFCYNRPFTEWIKDVAENPDEEFVVNLHTLADLSNDDRAYCVKVERLPERKYLVIFSDVTRLIKERERAKSNALTDPLTGSYNRRKFDDELGHEIERAKRYRRALALIMFDIDRFKQINDSFGHQAGDMALIELSNMIRSNIRKSDVFARIGGDEFMIILPETNIGGATYVAEKLRMEIERHAFEAGSITGSFGVTQYLQGDDTSSMFKRVDEMLYKAKNNGRNRVEVDESA
ncbi:MAG: diguanylate cyclase [Helicobacteraceae bacterium]|jgi:diguanylate cyclase (GGDEF)-like protein|nr:diguanylate cyclase [Helicobacteraceae bacterium]